MIVLDLPPQTLQIIEQVAQKKRTKHSRFYYSKCL